MGVTSESVCELWKPIEGFERLYQISNFGRVKSLPKMKGTVKQSERILKLKTTRKGYLLASLSKGNKMYWRTAHRLVAQAFIPNPHNKLEVNHINGIKTDNRVENLEWNTRTENEIHARKSGLKLMHGEFHPMSKVSDKQIEDIRNEYSTGNYTQKYLAQKFGLTQSHVSKIILNQFRNGSHI